MTETSKRIAIVGAGIVGVSAAIWLQRAGHEIILIDKAGPGEGTSYGNGGILASCSVVPVNVPGLMKLAPKMLFSPNQPLFLKWSYVPKLLPWLLKYMSHCNPEASRRIASALLGVVGDSLSEHQALAQGTGAEKWIVPSDYLFLYNDRAHFSGDAFGWSLRKNLGMRWDELEGQEFIDYDPVFSRDFKFAARFGEHGVIADPGQYVKDLAQTIVQNGGRQIKAEVDDFVRENGRLSGVRAGGETIACDSAVLATGVWSADLAEKLGLKIPLESERGYHLELWEPNFVPRAPVMVASGRFVITPLEGRIRLAGVVEFGGLDAPPSKAPIRLLQKNIRAAIPGLEWKETQEWMGHRPAPSDSIPIIGEAPDVKGAWMGFGHHHIGLTGGPKTGRLLSQLIGGQTPNIDVAPYSPSRFN